MGEGSGRTLDKLLKEFVLATDEDADRALATLYQEGIEPAVSVVIRHKMHISLRIDGEDRDNQIGLDLISGVKTALLPLLRRIRARSESAEFDNFRAYVRAAALNAYRQYLRDKYPNRLRLRNKVRYILTRQPAFAIWKDSSETSMCGLPAWRDLELGPIGAGAAEELRIALSQDASASGSTDDNASIIQVIESIFERAAGPIGFEDLISMIWKTLGLTEPQSVSDDDVSTGQLKSVDQNIEQRLDDQFLLERLWAKICTLPLRHRQALMLNLHDANGDNMLALFPSLGIASLRQIAAALEYEPADLAALWNKLPLDDLTIAGRMGLTRQQVINLRQSARASLRRGAI